MAGDRKIMETEYKIVLSWDGEAGVWIATSEDIYGLILEHESFDVLVDRVRYAVPELLAFEKKCNNDISLEFLVSRKEKLIVNG